MSFLRYKGNKNNNKDNDGDNGDYIHPGGNSPRPWVEIVTHVRSAPHWLALWRVVCATYTVLRAHQLNVFVLVGFVFQLHFVWFEI